MMCRGRGLASLSACGIEKRMAEKNDGAMAMCLTLFSTFSMHIKIKYEKETHKK